MSVSAAEVATCAIALDWPDDLQRPGQRSAGEHQHVPAALDAEVVVRPADLRAARARDERDRPAGIVCPLIRWLVSGDRRGIERAVAEPAVGPPVAGEMEDRRRQPGWRPGLCVPPFVRAHDEDPRRRGRRVRVDAPDVLVEESQDVSVEVDHRVRPEVDFAEGLGRVHGVPPGPSAAAGPPARPRPSRRSWPACQSPRRRTSRRCAAPARRSRRCDAGSGPASTTRPGSGAAVPRASWAR